MQRREEQPPKTSAARPGSGFSLIELLIVVAIILIIAAIAIPNFMRSRMAANESAAAASCRNITTAEVVYSTTYSLGYSPTLAALAPPPGGGPVSATNAGLIDDILATGTKSGYLYIYNPAAPDPTGRINSFTLNADPISVGVTGSRYFFTDQSGVVRQSMTGKATVNDPPI